MKTRVPVILFAGAYLLASAPAAAAGTGKPVRKYDSLAAVEWFDLLYDLTKAGAVSPPVASRNFGIAGVALYQALLPGMPEYASLAGQLNDLAPTPAPLDEKHHWPLVAHGALGRVTEQLFASAPAGSRVAIRVMKRQLGERLSAKVKDEVAQRSLDYGVAVADAVLAWAATDGFATYNNCAFVPPMGPGLWIPTPPGFVMNPVQPCWGQLRPMVLASSADCAPPDPPPFDTDPASAFYMMADEVYQTGLNLTAEQMAIADFWNDAPGLTGTPPGHWISIVGQLARDLDLDLDVTAEAYARAGIAVCDAFIQCWWFKFTYNLIRPVSYAQAHIPGAAAWLPYLVTPPFPEYTSGHSTQSGAASAILGDLFGTLPFTDDTHSLRNPELAYPARTFASIEDAGAEAALSRLYGGIHYVPANNNGLAAGQCIAQTILANVTFRNP